MRTALVGRIRFEHRWSLPFNRGSLEPPLGLIGILRSSKGLREKVQFGKVCTTKATDCGAFDRRKTLLGRRSWIYGVILEIEMIPLNALIMS